MARSNTVEIAIVGDDSRYQKVIGRVTTTTESFGKKIGAVFGGLQLDRAVQGQGLGISLREWRPDSWAGHGVSDLSSVTLHDPTGHMLLLSHMSSLLIEYDAKGAPLSLLSLWAGRHGLRAAVPQAEGVAIGPSGEVYIVSEPNLFYRFDSAARDSRP